MHALVAKLARNHAQKSKVRLKIHTKLATPTFAGWVTPTILTREHEGRLNTKGFVHQAMAIDSSSPLPSPGSSVLLVYVLCFYQPYVAPISQSRKYVLISKYMLKSQMRLKTRVYSIDIL